MNDHVKFFLDKINDIRKLTKKENRLKLNPWITRGILKSMRDRDKIYKQFTKETDATKKNDIFVLFKKKRNLITTLLRRSKTNYYASFLSNTKIMPKKLGKVSATSSIFLKNNTLPTKLCYNKDTFTDSDKMAEAYNSFFVTKSMKKYHKGHKPFPAILM